MTAKLFSGRSPLKTFGLRYMRDALKEPFALNAVNKRRERTRRRGSATRESDGGLYVSMDACRRNCGADLRFFNGGAS